MCGKCCSTSLYTVTVIAFTVDHKHPNAEMGLCLLVSEVKHIPLIQYNNCDTDRQTDYRSCSENVSNMPVCITEINTDHDGT